MCAAGVPSSHSSSEARIHGMAPRQRPAPRQPQSKEDGPAMAASIVPFGVASGKDQSGRPHSHPSQRGRGGVISKPVAATD